MLWKRLLRRGRLWVAFCGGGTVGLASSVIRLRSDVCPVQNSSETLNAKWRISGPIKTKDNIISRRITTDFDKSGLNLRLYQYEVCPFCCKVRAFLDYYGFSYDIVEVSPLTRKEIKSLDGMEKLPSIVIDNGKGNRVLNDSSFIISFLATYLWQTNKSTDELMDLYPETRFIVQSTGKELVARPNLYEVFRGDAAKLSKSQLELIENEKKWRKWIDDSLINLIKANVYRSWSEALQLFKWYSEAANWDKSLSMWERLIAVYFGSLVMCYSTRTLRKNYGFGNIRVPLFKACDLWIGELGSARFLGGDEPNLADLSVYGALSSILGSTTFQELCDNTEIERWFTSMQEIVDSRAGAKLIEKRSSINK